MVFLGPESCACCTVSSENRAVTGRSRWSPLYFGPTFENCVCGCFHKKTTARVTLRCATRSIHVTRGSRLNGLCALALGSRALV